MVTHDLDTLISLSSRVAVLCDQRLIAIGSVREVAQNTHQFICNFFQGERGRRAVEAAEKRADEPNPCVAGPVENRTHGYGK